MSDPRLTSEEYGILLSMEVSSEYQDGYRDITRMARVIVERAPLHRLKKLCQELGVRHTSVASLLIHRHNHSINEQSADWLHRLDLIPISHLAALSISQLASQTASNISRILRCKKGSVATAVLLDCLPVLGTMPETIPGIKSLIKYPSRSRRPIGLYKTTRDKVSARCRLLADETDERLSVSDYVRTALSTVPTAEIEAILRSEDFAVALSNTVEKSKVSCIEVDTGLYEYLKDLSKYLGCSVTRIVSFFIDEELRATEQGFKYEEEVIPLNPVSRWKTILNHYIRSGN